MLSPKITCFYKSVRIKITLHRFDGVRYGHRARAGGSLDEEIYTLTRDEGFSEKVKRRITAGNFFLLEESVCCSDHT